MGSATTLSMQGATTTGTANGSLSASLTKPKPSYTIIQAENGFMVNVFNDLGVYETKSYVFAKFIDLAAFLEARLDF